MKFKMGMIVSMLVGLQVWLSSCFNANKAISSDAAVSQGIKTAPASIYDIKVKTIDGKEIKLSEYRGKQIIILNTASQCGYTPQYEDWQNFYVNNSHKAVVLGFPCNQFMGQEPGSNKEISTFCTLNFGVTFPMFEKVDVKGDHQSALYAWLSDPAKNGWCEEVPSWNFCKYIISEKGELTHFFGSKIKPESPEFLQAMSAK